MVIPRRDRSKGGKAKAFSPFLVEIGEYGSLIVIRLKMQEASQVLILYDLRAKSSKFANISLSNFSVSFRIK